MIEQRRNTIAALPAGPVSLNPPFRAKVVLLGSARLLLLLLAGHLKCSQRRRPIPTPGLLERPMEWWLGALIILLAAVGTTEILHAFDLMGDPLAAVLGFIHQLWTAVPF